MGIVLTMTRLPTPKFLSTLALKSVVMGIASTKSSRSWGSKPSTSLMSLLNRLKPGTLDSSPTVTAEPVLQVLTLISSVSMHTTTQNLAARPSPPPSLKTSLFLTGFPFRIMVWLDEISGGMTATYTGSMEIGQPLSRFSPQTSWVESLTPQEPGSRTMSQTLLNLIDSCQSIPTKDVYILVVGP